MIATPWHRLTHDVAHRLTEPGAGILEDLLDRLEVERVLCADPDGVSQLSVLDRGHEGLCRLGRIAHRGKERAAPVVFADRRGLATEHLLGLIVRLCG